MKLKILATIIQNTTKVFISSFLFIFIKEKGTLIRSPLDLIMSSSIA